MTENGPDVSDTAVTKATGRTWKQWRSALDEWGAADSTHKEIVGLVRERGEVGSPWWQQTVAVGYEKLTGRRITGQTKDTGFQVGVQRTVDVDLKRTWKWLTSSHGMRAWLGSVQDSDWGKGKRYELEDGAEGEVRVFRPEQRLRVTWKPPGWTKPSTIQIGVEAKGDRTVVRFHEENLPSKTVRERRREHFMAALEKLATEAPTGSS